MILGEEHQDAVTITVPSGLHHRPSVPAHPFHEDTVSGRMPGPAANEDHIDESYKAEAILHGLASRTRISTTTPHRCPAATSAAELGQGARVRTKPPAARRTTNYLDIVSVRWLTQFLRAWRMSSSSSPTTATSWTA